MSHGAPWRCWGGRSGDQEERFRSWRRLFNPGHFGKQEFWEKEEVRSASHHPSLLPTSTASHPPPSFSPYSSHFPIPALQLQFTDLPIVSSCSEEGGHSIREHIPRKNMFSFGHCPNCPPPPQKKKLGKFFFDVKNGVFKTNSAYYRTK